MRQLFPCLRAIGTLSLLLAVPSGPRPAAAAADTRRDLFDDLYDRGATIQTSLKTLTARFTETTTSCLLTRPLIAHGTLAVERPSRVVLNYLDPDRRVVLIDADRMTIAWPSRGVRQVRDIGAAQARIQKYFVNRSPGELRQHFDIRTELSPERAGAYHMTMVPRRKQIKEGLATLELWVGRDSLLMTAMRMTFANNDAKLMTFDEVKPNGPVDRSLFSVPE